MELTELVKLFGAKEAAAAQGAVQRGRSVTLGEHEAVTIGILFVLGIDVHHIEVQRNERFRAGKRAAGMAGASLVRHRDNITPHLTARGLESLNVHS